MDDSLLSFDEMVSATHGKLISEKIHEGESGCGGASGHSFKFTSVATDSRNVCAESLFVPLIGEKQNGHLYIVSAIEKGASVVFVGGREYDAHCDDYDKMALRFPNVFFIRVENTLHAFQNAAARYVEKFPGLKKIGVTGSSGKTTTKEMIASCLRQKYNVLANAGNLNSETGVPLTAFQIRKEHEVGVFEMGMNRQGEMAEIAAVIKPNIALVTNIGTAHVGMLGSRDAISREKKNICNYIGNKTGGAFFVPAADDYVDFLCEDIKGDVIKYGSGVTSEKCGIEFVSDLGLEGTRFRMDGVEITLPLPGKYNYENALGAVSVARYMGVSVSEIKRGIENMAAISGRAETVKIEISNGKYITVFKDCYNANPDSMHKSIEFCSSIEMPHDSKNAKKIFVLGDMGELGCDSRAAHENVGKLVAEAMPDVTVFVGAEMQAAFDVAKNQGYKNGHYINSTDDAAMASVAEIVCHAVSGGDVVLLKGSRAVALERVMDAVASAFNSTFNAGNFQKMAV